MSRTKFFILGAIAVVLAILALVLGFQSRWQNQAESGQRFFPELEERLNDITRLQVQIAGFDPVTVVRQDDRWGVQERDGYPADVGLLRRELLTLAQLERVEGMTSNPEKYERLGLQPLDAEGSEAREIRLWAGDQSLAQLLAGKSGPGGGTYVRLEDNPQSWLSSAAVNSPSQPADWLDKELISITPNRLYRISMQPVAGEAYTLGKSSLRAAGFTLEPVLEGKQVKGPELQRLSGAINALRLEDVVAEGKGPESDTPWTKAQFETFDGLVIDVQSRAVEGKHYLKLDARFDNDLAQQFQKAAEDAQVQDAATSIPPLDSIEAVKATAAQLAERFKGWLFIVPEFKAELFGLTHDSLFEDQAQAATPQPTPEAGAVIPDPTIPQVQPPPNSVVPAAPTEQSMPPAAPTPESAADSETPSAPPAVPENAEPLEAPEVAPAATPEPAPIAAPPAEPAATDEADEPLEASEEVPDAEAEQDTGAASSTPADSAEPLEASEVVPTAVPEDSPTNTLTEDTLDIEETPTPQAMPETTDATSEPTTEAVTSPVPAEASEAIPPEPQEQQEPAVQPSTVGGQ